MGAYIYLGELRNLGSLLVPVTREGLNYPICKEGIYSTVLHRVMKIKECL